MYIMKKRKWERWMAGACLLVLLGSFFSPMAVGKARAEMDSAEEILSTLGTSPAKIYELYHGHRPSGGGCGGKIAVRRHAVRTGELFSVYDTGR